MNNIKREDIQIIARHSNWSEKSIENTLKENIYNDKKSWQKFLRLLLISLGIGFTISGIIFFFAYNWNELHKFVKIGLIEGLIIILSFIILFSKINLNLKNIILTATSMLVGVLFAVFGQIYQTGANAYDFFLSWTMFITTWVLVSNYPPLWLIFITLVNTTFILFWQQVTNNWPETLPFLLLFIVNTLFLVTFLFGKKINHKIKCPVWFSNTIALASVSYSTIGIIIGIFERSQTSFFVLIISTLIIYSAGIKYSLTEKKGFYLSIISFSIISIISAFFLKLSADAGMFFFIGFFIIISVTFVIKNLIKLQKKWTN